MQKMQKSVTFTSDDKVKKLLGFFEIEEGKYQELGMPTPYHVQEALRILRHQ